MTDLPAGALIAVVDDDPGVLKSLEYLLESAGHAVLAFGSAAALLDGGVLVKIDCVISDVHMPVMNGFALSQAIRQIRPELPVILITGHPGMLERPPTPDAGRRRVFTKPFNGQELLMAVSDALENMRTSTRQS